MAHAITALRVLLTVPLIFAIRGHLPGWSAAFLFALIAASDVLDGRVARAGGTASNWGRAFDHGADIVFVLACFGTYAVIGVASWLVPTSIAVAFALYVIDARGRGALTSRRRAAGRIGHWGGVCNYVVIGVLIGNETLALRVFPPAVIQLMLTAVPLYSLAAVVVRWFPSSHDTTSTLTVR